MNVDKLLLVIQYTVLKLINDPLVNVDMLLLVSQYTVLRFTSFWFLKVPTQVVQYAVLRLTKLWFVNIPTDVDKLTKLWFVKVDIVPLVSQCAVLKFINDPLLNLDMLLLVSQ